MSWQSWADNVAAYPGVAGAALVGFDGSIWAQSAGFVGNAAEAAKIASMIDSPDTARASGFHLAGKKHFVIIATPGQISGKAGSAGAYAAKSKTCIVIAHYVEPTTQQELNGSVDKFVETLVAAGC
eukprot:NODE_2290_length_587_cov_614.375465_g1813_i0.p2 GENE.NODE_2290_length_587_cov_614.375465_g1813_i0~~NODE_2290_length_587_cov_614.375465_g1813_i0.p2  ORF type:complete len:145 (-),score=53.66 NODE_2290_length_587_cov_614.375465_g1813_i0:152-529(-)